MSQPMPQPAAHNVELKGGAAIVAPPSAFPGGVPGNALIVLPLSQPPPELAESLEKGPVVVTPEQMWKLLGFNGPAVQVQDQEGRPIAIGLEDLLSGLEKHWDENPEELDRGRIFANELMKYARFEQAEKVIAQVVKKGGQANDWLQLGVAELSQEKWDRAIGTLTGAQNLAADNPLPSMHLARAQKGKGDRTKERAAIERAIRIDGNFVDAWIYLFQQIKETESEEKAIEAITKLADEEPNKGKAAAFVGLQTLFAADEATADKAVEWGKKAVARNPNDPMALVGLSALYGQQGKLDEVIALLSKHEAMMTKDVRLANNYFQALFQSRQIDKVTKLLNALAGSPDPQIKQYAIEQSRAVQQMLQQQAAQLGRSVRT